MGHSAVFKHPYELPEIKLANARTIIDVAVAEARIEGSIRRGIANSGIDDAVLERAEKLFYDLDKGNTGAVEPHLLEPVFRALGVYITADEILYVMANFDMEGMSDLSFPEVVEIASFLLENR
jgi:Ca2+-binding EF-hand superfamily protein